MKKFGAKKIAVLATAMALVTVGGVYATWTYTDTPSDAAYDTIYVTLATATETSGDAAGTYAVSNTVGLAGKIYTIDQYSNALENLYDDTSNTGGVYAYIVVYDSNTSSPEVISYNEETINIYDGNTVTSKTTTSYATASTYTKYNDYTAALCISYGSSIDITFTADQTKTTATAYDIGINTYFSFAWTTSAPYVYRTSEGYATSDSNTGTYTEYLNLDESAHYIYTTSESGSSVMRTWSDENSNFTGSAANDGIFYYQVNASELLSYLIMDSYVIAGTMTQYGYLESGMGDGKLTLTITEAGDVLTKPTVGYTTTSGSEAINITAVTNASGYRVGFFNATTDGTPLYTYDTTTTGANISISDMLPLDVADGIYYIKVRALADSSSYANSEWTDAEYYITVSSGIITAMTAVQ